MMSSSDGFCSCLVFVPGELGTIYTPPAQTRHIPGSINTSSVSGGSTPSQTPTGTSAPSFPRPASAHGLPPPASPVHTTHPASPARSMSISSATTQESHVHMTVEAADTMRHLQSSTPHISSVPSLTAATAFTPPQTPGFVEGAAPIAPATVLAAAPIASSGVKREAENIDVTAEKKRRIAPTPVTHGNMAAPAPLMTQADEHRPANASRDN